MQALLPRMQGDVVIVLRGGRYQLESTLALGSADSGRNGWRVRYVAAPSETPVICSGVPIGGWQQGTGAHWWLWSAPLPAAFASLPQPAPRQIYVNGLRATRVRGAWPSGGGTMTAGSTGFTVSPNPIANWRNPQTIEFVYRIQWMEHHLPVSSVSPGAIVMQDTNGAPWTAAKTLYGPSYAPSGPPTFVDHAYELLGPTTPGQFWVDSVASCIYYVPRPGENLATAQVLAPALDALLSLSDVSDVSFEGLVFAEGSWLGVNQTGLATWGANSYVTSNAMALAGGGVSLPGCVRAVTSRNLTWDGCSLERLGGAGLWMASSCTDCTVQDCSFTDISAGGITADGNAPGTRYTQATNTWTISRNVVHDCNLEFCSGEGLSVLGGAGAVVTHNSVYNLPYLGVDIRGQGRAEYNHVHDVMRTLIDGGALYSWGESAGLLVRRNWCHTAPIAGNGGALYQDNYSRHKSFLNNVVYHETGNSTPTLFANPPGSANAMRYNFSDAATQFFTGFSGTDVSMNRLVSPSAPAPASVTSFAGPQVPPAPKCSAPRSVTLLSTSPQTSALTLGWTAPEQGTATFYEVWDDNADLVLGTTTGVTFLYADLAPGGQYVFSVRAVDAFGGVSVPSTPLVMAAPVGTVARSTYGTGWE